MNDDDPTQLIITKAIPMPRTPPKYVIIENYTKHGLEKDIDTMMLEGWRPTGGLAVRNSNIPSQVYDQDYKPIYSQAMVKGV